jgi:type II secretory pathway pseudopilin PulG
LGNIRESFTLTEMLVSAFIIALLLALGISAYKKAMDSSSLIECKARLSQIGIALNSYTYDYDGLYPEGEAPDDFSDISNWADLWGSSDYPSPYFFTATCKTKMPRLPRLLEDYIDDVATLHCTDRSQSRYWPDVGPYSYNTTCPWGTTAMPDGGTDVNIGLWLPMVNYRNPGKSALAACQNPLRYGMLGLGGWRHGKKGASSSSDGLNNHLYADGSVFTHKSPAVWNAK